MAEDRGARTITGETMARAIRLGQWYLKEALRLHQNGTTPHEILKAERLLDWIKECGHKHVSLRLIQRSEVAGLDLKAKAEPVI